jgi:uncharacterized protein YecA (UPF0149 family)
LPNPSANDWEEDVGDSAYEPPQKPFIRLEEKVGRNDPCPCGSGKKFKKCCLRATTKLK